MIKRHKDLLRAIVADVRRTLAGAATADSGWERGDLDRELERLGVAPDGTVTPIDALPGATPAERRAHALAAAQLTRLPAAGRAAARGEIVERAAYTWINRLLALRAMEARGLIDETLRANPDYDGLSEALFVLRQTAPARAAGPDAGWWAVLDNACDTWRTALPGLFDPTDPAAALRPSTPALLRCVATTGSAPAGFTLDEADAAFADPDAIGWCYQFYQEAAKARVYAKLGKGGKAATRAEIAAATQLFTEPYMVKWLLQNSLGRSYHELHPDSALPATWEYYIRELPNGPQPPAVASFDLLTVMDPCCGSGHFLREAFDLLAAVYRERRPDLDAAEIADRILARHLHGIDLDPRCAQLTALTLWLRAWETVRDEARAHRRPGAPRYAPPAMSVATTPTSLDPGALARHLARHPGDRPLRPLLEGVFAALEQADILGSLLRPGAQLDEAIAALQRPRQLRMDADPDEATLRQRLAEQAQRDPAGLKAMLMERVAASLAAEKGNRDDAAAQLFGREGEQGVRLLQLLGRQYAVVTTNPPYMGSKNMATLLQQYVERHFSSGKRDLYAAFILRSINICQSSGRVAMVTQQSFMFLRSFMELRSIPENSVREAERMGHFAGLIRQTTIEALSHLGRYAFSEIGNAHVAPVLIVVKHSWPMSQSRVWSCRLSAPRPSDDQAILLRRSVIDGIGLGLVTQTLQSRFLTVPQFLLCYWLSERFLSLISEAAIGSKADLAEPTTTGDSDRFMRGYWEVWPLGGWVPASRGGGYSKWAGLDHWVMDWRHAGVRLKSFPGSYVRNEHLMFLDGLTYTEAASGSLGVRRLLSGGTFAKSGPGIVARADQLPSISALLNGRVSSYLLRITARSFFFGLGSIRSLPIPSRLPDALEAIERLATVAKRTYIGDSPIEFDFSNRAASMQGAVSAVLHTIEAYNERLVFGAYQLQESDIQVLLGETGVPAGWYPLIADYDTLPMLPADLALPCIPREVLDVLATHKRIMPDAHELVHLRERLRELYEAGPGVRENGNEATDDAAVGEAGGDGDEAAVVGAQVPIPPETFLEELSLKLQIHPISVYWLLEELRAEGARSKPEEQRLLEDRLSVLVLSLLGHRWPKQLEAGEPLPHWSDRDGVIPLTTGAGEPTVADRLRARLRAEDGELGAQQTEALLTELTGLTLEDWCRQRFFERHVRQFKYRPVAWHLASTPQAGAGRGRRGGARRQPAFECLLYYHACGGDVLARIRTQYVEPLLRGARQQADDARRDNDETAAAIAGARIDELDDFAARLRQVEAEGFACAELDALLATEPLDRWTGDGYMAPPSREALLHDERTWRVDINDGVRVNIAPLQLAGLLANDVLKAADAKKAIADRARWRSDERRWVREGKLPRCGWLEEAVPESPRWTELTPQREAEALKLEQKRQAALARLGSASTP
ncbi:MAG: hypothetical protein IT340_19580 [Chloroflexi bacterium]|nr:hypothetical protein [Chloroflexota bacterium]